MNSIESQTLYHAGVFRRLAALVYDSLIVLAVLLFATALAMLPVAMIAGSEAISENQVLVENPIFFSWLIFSWFYYYAWCWRHGGQTVGMKAWRIRVVAAEGENVTWKHCLIRFATAVVGLANLWAFFGDKRGWHDILSKTNVIHMPKNKKNNEAES